MIERHHRATHTLVIDRTGTKPVVYRVPHGKTDKGPGVIRKAANFTKAAVRHVAAGRPNSSPELIAERFAICDVCEFLYREKMRCLKCGCGVNKVKGKLSKLSWADSKCPVGKW